MGKWPVNKKAVLTPEAQRMLKEKHHLEFLTSVIVSERPRWFTAAWLSDQKSTNDNQFFVYVPPQKQCEIMCYDRKDAMPFSDGGDLFISESVDFKRRYRVEVKGSSRAFTGPEGFWYKSQWDGMWSRCKDFLIIQKRQFDKKVPMAKMVIHVSSDYRCLAIVYKRSFKHWYSHTLTLTKDYAGQTRENYHCPWEHVQFVPVVPPPKFGVVGEGKDDGKNPPQEEDAV